ncbi:hypothetical protein [Planctomyces sp. SH-PL14]|uniref:hypothetical protein n=1 Tax=Planctomyces sp. SH-PL14 TaxID=1632864 RepID=UPI00078E4797|nr:hypothetical protein [Planctomyces sp. SH-PL14]AMV22397.1 hypothetical protein VT03_31170 [Planctomyces sp. SH-PL14]
MSRRSALLCGAGLLTIALMYFAVSTDWYAYGDAVPPAVAATTSKDGVQALAWGTGETAAGADRGVPAGEKFLLSGTIPLDVDRWWWNPSRSSGDWGRHAKANQHKPVPLLRAELVSRSSLDSGEFVAASYRLKLRPDGKGAARFRTEIRAPARPGVYELRLLFGSLRLTQLVFVQEWTDERVIATRPFRVQAGNASTP